MKSYTMAAVIVVSTMIGTPSFTSIASAQTVQNVSSGSYFVPVVVGALAGATVGALVWPVMVPAGGAMMGTGATLGAGPGTGATIGANAGAWGWGAFYTTRAVVGAIIGGGLGYLAAR
jgi:hypothetical protein